MEIHDSDVTVILPALNEAESIGDVVTRIRGVSAGYTVIVVDDGSTDGTDSVAAGAGAKVVRHESNYGNGAAVKTGIRAAKTSVVVMMDADGQHPPEAIPQLIEQLRHADMVIGSRRPAAQFWFRRLGNIVLNAFARLLTGRAILDLTSGFRAIRRDAVLEYIHLFPTGFSYPTTSTIAFLKGGYRVKFQVIESMKRRDAGISKIRPFRDGLKFMTIMVRLSVLFDPMRVFVPPGLLILSAGIGLGVFQISRYGRIEEYQILLILSGLLILFVGFLADLVASLTTKRKP